MRALNESQIREFLAHDYARVVNAVALAGVGHAEAEDSVQEALVRAWVHSEKGHTIERLDAWVAVAAWNHSRSRLRRLGVERRARDRLGVVSSARQAPVPDDALDLDRALSALPRRLRQVAILRYVLHLSTSETAIMLGVAEGTVKRALSDARQSLSESLRVDDGEEAPGAIDR